jgi:hypothetical protein
MSGFSVTGKGHGDSKGGPKPESNTGCCGPKPPVEIAIVPIKQSCYTRLSTNNRTIYKAGGSTGIRVCS